MPTCTPKNFLVGDAGARHVIDFDDAGFGWHQYELAVALYEIQDHPDTETITAACVAGYREVRPLSGQALELLPLFLLIRQLVSIGWMWTRPELGERRYIPRLIDDACERIDAFSF